MPGRWVCGAGELHLTNRRLVYVPAGLGGGIAIGGKGHLLKQLVEIPLSSIVTVETTRRFPLLWLPFAPLMGRAERRAVLHRFVLGPLYGPLTRRLLVGTAEREFVFDVADHHDWVTAILGAAH